MTEQADKYREASTQMNRLAELDEEQAEAKDSIEEQLEVNFDDTKLTSIFSNSYVMSEFEEITKLSSTLKINATDARKQLTKFPNEYIMEGHSIPDIIRKMRKSRRALKGEYRTKMTKTIDTMIDAYADHLQKCIKSITWLSDYTIPLSKMRYNEKDLSKLNMMKSSEMRRDTVDSLCKYWEAEQKQEGMAYGKKYSNLHKEMRLAKKDFRNSLAKVSSQAVTKTKKKKQEDFILKTVCENPGISAGLIHERMPSDLHKLSSPNVISKMVKKLDIVSVDGGYHKVHDDIKKNIWAYTAAFIDSDGYITLDRNMNPRVGLIATGSRGKAFMQEMHKSIGYGRMHLDQKSPQQTRLIQRLNFYSQDDVTKLLKNCLPHFRLKKGNAKLLLELIRMKKGYKKTDWYKPRCDEIFKLMKWENHKDHVGFDWLKEGIYLNDITKLQKNCKTSVMDGLENHESILKSQMATMMAAVVAQENQRMDRMANPTMRVEEEENVNQKVGTIDMDMDIEGDCCSQLKAKIIEAQRKTYDYLLEDRTWEELIEHLVMNHNSSRDIYSPNYELHMEEYADWLNEQDCEYLANDFLKENKEKDLKLIEEYDSCLTSNMGEDFNTKNAMLKYTPEMDRLQHRRQAKGRIKREINEEAQSSIQIDYEATKENCCQVAKTEVMKVWSDRIERYTSEGRTDKANTVEKEYDVLDTMPCDELKAHITYIVDINEAAPKGKKINPELVELKRILEEWNDCEGDEGKTKEAMLKAIIKQQERTFIIDSYEKYVDEGESFESTLDDRMNDQQPLEQNDDDSPLEQPTPMDNSVSYFMALTAKELGVDEDSDIEEIQEQLLNHLEDEVGGVLGYTWYEITAKGRRRDWLNPKTRYDQI